LISTQVKENKFTQKEYTWVLVQAISTATFLANSTENCVHDLKISKK
jgi:hypothetical protein